MTTLNAAPVTTHLAHLNSLTRNGDAYLMGMLGSHFVSHDTLDRETLVRYAAEAEAIS